MQWDSDRNAGFSSANPQRLYLPVIIDPEYHSQAINVEAQQENPNSLLWWMRRLIGLRRRFRAFGRGTLELLRPDNRKVVAFLRRYEDETILVVANLSRFTQAVELDLSQCRGAVPVELFGNTRFPAVGDLPYFVTLGPHGFYWFNLESISPDDRGSRPSLRVRGGVEELFAEPALRQLESVLAGFVAERRWFAEKSRSITAATVADVVPIPSPRRLEGPLAWFLLVNVELDYGSPETYCLSLAHATGGRLDDLCRYHPEAIVADVASAEGDGVLFDAVWAPELSQAVLELTGRRRQLVGRSGRLAGVPTPAFRSFRDLAGSDITPVPMNAEQSNSSVIFGDRAIVKYIRRFQEGVNPGVEIGRFLGERAHFEYAPPVGGSVEYRSDAPGAEPAVVGLIEGYVANEGDGWSYVVDALGLGLEEALAHHRADELRIVAPPHLLDVRHTDLEPGHLLIGPHLEWASLLGRRTAELHRALASDPSDPDFEPEPLTAMERQALFHGARSLVNRVFRQLGSTDPRTPAAEEVLAREGEVAQRLRVISAHRIQCTRIRCHGDYHLGQVLWTGKDFVIIDFEGEPTRSLGQRRLKRPAPFDLAGMIRSFHYASRSAALRLSRDLGTSLEPALETWLTLWYRWVAGTFLGAYVDGAGSADFLPSDESELANLLDFFLLEKAVYELGYEVNNRPGWVDIPARGIIELLDAGP